MRNAMRGAALAATLMGLALGLTAAAPALADVKAGVDAWSRGEYKKAVEIWRVDANAGDADAQFNMGQAYRLGRGVPVDLPMAEGWFRKAAMQGHVEAITNYGLTLFDEGKRSEAVPWLEKSVARGEPRAQMVLGTMLFNGDGVQKDWPRAYALLVRSAASGLPRAAQVQAQMDEYIPLDQRQRGLVLAREYEAAAQRPELPPEIAGVGSGGTMRGTELPPSSYDPNAGQQPAIADTRPPPPARPAPVVTQVPATTRPAPPPVAAAPRPASVAARGGGWKLQLGAYRDESNAHNLWRKIENGGVVPGLQGSFPRAGALTRLVAGPLASRADAVRACGAIKAAIPGTACVPLAP
ncbi:MAG: SPOR domain-containing protein [Sphingomonas sp.]|uniref:SPOR domain-containing protein n=1 Tax=Sphingomonas sp. TaxID=28214 RepID=UPI003566E5BD